MGLNTEQGTDVEIQTPRPAPVEVPAKEPAKAR